MATDLDETLERLDQEGKIEDCRDALSRVGVCLGYAGFRAIGVHLRALNQQSRHSAPPAEAYARSLLGSEPASEIELAATSLRRASEFAAAFCQSDPGLNAAITSAREHLHQFQSLAEIDRLLAWQESIHALRVALHHHANSEAGLVAVELTGDVRATLAEIEDHLGAISGRKCEALPDLPVPNRVRASLALADSLRAASDREGRQHGEAKAGWSIGSAFGALLYLNVLLGPILGLVWLSSTVSLIWEWAPCLPAIGTWDGVLRIPQAVVLFYQECLRWIGHLPWGFTLIDIPAWLKDLTTVVLMCAGVAGRRARWEVVHRLGGFAERDFKPLEKLAIQLSVITDFVLLAAFLPIRRRLQKRFLRIRKHVWRGLEDQGLHPDLGENAVLRHTVYEWMIRPWIFGSMFAANAFMLALAWGLAVTWC